MICLTGKCSSIAPKLRIKEVLAMKGTKSTWKVAAVFVVVVLLATTLPLSVSKAEASSATIYVPDDYPTIQAAVNAASPGDTIIVRDGTYYENV